MKKAIISGLQWYLKNDSIFRLFIFFFISIPNLDQIIPQFINVIAPNNNLVMDELNMIYFLYLAQSLEIQGIKSRLYMKNGGSGI